MRSTLHSIVCGIVALSLTGCGGEQAPNGQPAAAGPASTGQPSAANAYALLPSAAWQDLATNSQADLTSDDLAQLTNASVGKLTELLQDDNYRLRTAAMAELSQRCQADAAAAADAKVAVPALLENLSAPWPECRAAAAECLVELPTHSPELLEKLALLVRDGTTLAERTSAARAIGALGLHAAPLGELLRQRIEQESVSPATEVAPLFEALFVALARQDDTQPIMDWSDLERMPDDVRQQSAILALGSFDPMREAAVSRLDDVLAAGSSMDAHRAAVRALAAASPKEPVILELLGGELNSRDDEYYQFVVKTIRTIPPDVADVRPAMLAGLEEGIVEVAWLIEQSALSDDEIVRLALQAAATLDADDSSSAVNYILIDDEPLRLKLLLEALADTGLAEEQRHWAARSLVQTYWDYHRLLSKPFPAHTADECLAVQRAILEAGEIDSLPPAAQQTLELANANLLHDAQRARVGELLHRGANPRVRELAGRLIAWQTVTAPDSIRYPDLLPALTAAAADSESAASYFAATALGGLGEAARPALPALAKILSDGTSSFPDDIALAIGEIGDPDGVSVPALLAEIRKRDMMLSPGRKAFGIALGKVFARDPDLVKKYESELREFLREEDGAAGVTMLECLGIAGEAAQPLSDILTEFVMDEEQQFRERAITVAGLARINPDELIPYLAPRLKSEKSFDYIRDLTAEAFGHYGEAAQDHLPDIVKYVMKDYEEWSADYSAVTSLIAFGPLAQGFLPQLVARFDELSQDDAKRRFQLGMALYAVAGEQPDVRYRAVSAMIVPESEDLREPLTLLQEEFGDRFLEILAAGLVHPDPAVRARVPAELARFSEVRTRSAIGRLARYLDQADTDPVERREVIKQLTQAELTDNNMDLIRAALADADLGVRAAAASVLIQAGPATPEMLKIIAEAAAARVDGSAWTYRTEIEYYPSAVSLELFEILLGESTPAEDRANAGLVLARLYTVPDSLFPRCLELVQGGDHPAAPYAAIILANFESGRELAKSQSVDLATNVAASLDSEIQVVQTLAAATLQTMETCPGVAHAQLFKMIAQSPDSQQASWASSVLSFGVFGDDDIPHIVGLLEQPDAYDAVIAFLDGRKEPLAPSVAAAILPGIAKAAHDADPQSSDAAAFGRILALCGDAGRAELMTQIQDQSNEPNRRHLLFTVLEDVSELTAEEHRQLEAMLADNDPHAALHAAMVLVAHGLSGEAAGKVLLERLANGPTLDVNESLAAFLGWKDRPQAEVGTAVMALFERRHELKNRQFAAYVPLLVTDKQAAVAALVSALATARVDESHEDYVNALLNMGSEGVPHLAAALASPDADTRRAAATVLSMSDVELLTPVRAAIQTAWENETRSASKATAGIARLAALVAPEAVEKIDPLLTALPYPNESLRDPRFAGLTATLRALTNLEQRAAPAAPQLIQLCNRATGLEADCFNALGQLSPGSAEARKYLLATVPELSRSHLVADALSKSSPLSDELTAQLQSWLTDEGRSAAAAKLLGKQGTADAQKQAVETLLKLADDPLRQAEAVRNLGLLGAEAKVAAPQLLAAVESQDHATVVAAVISLGRLCEFIPEASAVLAARLTDERTRIDALDAIAAAGPAAAATAPGLKELLQDEEVRVRAVKCIGKLGPSASALSADLKELRQQLNTSAYAGNLRRAIDVALIGIQQPQ